MLCLGRADPPGLVRVVMPEELLVEPARTRLCYFWTGHCQNILVAWDVCCSEPEIKLCCKEDKKANEIHHVHSLLYVDLITTTTTTTTAVSTTK